MDPKVLADALVEAGIGYQGKYPLSRDGVGFYHEPDEGAGMCAELFITDWRVAGKCLESMYTTDIAVEDNGEWSVIMNGRNSAGWIKSLPRAIIEAWYEARRGNLPEKN